MTTAILIRDSLIAHKPHDPWSIKFRRRGYQQMLVVRSQFNFYYFWEKRWFFIAMTLGALLLSLPLPAGRSREAEIVLIMSLVATILYITDRGHSRSRYGESRCRCQRWPC